LEAIYRTKRGVERVRASWLGEPIACFVAKRIAQGYHWLTVRQHAARLLSFGIFLKRRGIQSLQDVPRWVEPFLKSRNQGPGAGAWRTAVTQFIADLREKGMLPVPEPVPSSCPHADLATDYSQFLLDHRGVGARYAKWVGRFCEAFLCFLSGQGITEPGLVTAEAIYAFITLQGQDRARCTMRTRCVWLRGFLKHLYRRGILATDLGNLVIGPRIYEHEQCPRFLTRHEVEATLAAVNREARHGRRNYAMLLLLATYGLRGNEVLRLRLDDIDWRQQRLYIRKRKAGNDTTYPLTAAVGKALLDYLRNERPRSSHREIFLSTFPPFRPLTCTSTLGFQARRHLRHCGITIDRPGTHTFRYSCAQRLFDGGATLKSIGDFLGHRDLRSTERYTKIDIERLRDVAASDVEELL
jgi:site-specific recombinase XerD